MPPKKLMDLSNDILTLLVTYIRRPSDLVSLCLACKRLHEISVRQLYHTVELDLGGPSDRRLAAFLNPRNLGVPHIRNVEVWHAKDESDDAQSKQCQFAISMLLELLPANQLERFRWHQWDEFAIENVKQLFKRQKRLKWLEAITLTEQNFNDELKKSLDFDSMMGNCSEVGLWLDSRQAIEMGAELVKRVLKLQKLTIRASFDKTDPVIPHQELNDTINAPGLITGTVFRHMAPFENSKPLEVSTLFVEEIALSYCRITYCRVIDMSKLHTLKIHNCSGADSLLVELSSSSRLPHGLKVLEFKHEDEDRECRGLGAIESFLCMISGLENLVIDLLTTRNLPQVNSITRHAKTLKLLGIHATNNDREEHVYDYPSFDKIFSSCTELEQLSIAAPSCEITRIATSQPDSFKRSLTGSSSVMNNLRTLQITTFPSEQSVRHCLPRSIYEHLLQAEATSLFKTRDNSKALQKLNIVAWGVIDRLHFRCYNNDTIFIYGRGKLLHPDGKESPMASLVPSALHGYVESRSDVIDFIHHKYHGFSPQDDDDDI